MWREGDAEARANLAIEGMDLDADEHALFDMLRADAVPPPPATAIVLKLLDHPDADPALAIPPATIPADGSADMAWFRQLGRAPRNLARSARDQPIWPIKIGEATCVTRGCKYV